MLSKYVTIRIYDNGETLDPFTFEISALMRTRGDYSTRDDRRNSATENEALRRAIRILTQDYEEAIRRGEMPDDGWLVEQASPTRR